MITEDMVVREIYKLANTKVAMKDIDIVVRDFIAIIKNQLQKGEQVYLSELGTLSSTEKVKHSFIQVSKVANKK